MLNISLHNFVLGERSTQGKKCVVGINLDLTEFNVRHRLLLDLCVKTAKWLENPGLHFTYMTLEAKSKLMKSIYYQDILITKLLNTTLTAVNTYSRELFFTCK